MSGHGTFEHVYDDTSFHLPGGGHLDLPSVLGLQITKFMVLQLAAFAICLIVFRGLAKRAAGGQPVMGRFWNFWEAIALFIRDEVVRPTIGEPHHDDHHPHGLTEGHGLHGEHGHEIEGIRADAPRPIHGAHAADKYLPFLWSSFFYILICNLLGAIPFLGSPTGSISVTAALALCAFIATVMYGFREMGPSGFFSNMMPDTGIAGPMGQGLSLGIFGIEIFGFFIKHSVLAVRLFANIMGGHTVIGVILAFIASGASQGWLWGPITLGSIGMQVFIGLLELFVAFLQAYVFTFLATIFIAGAIHEH